MAGIRVVTDSACDLSDELAASNGISVVPLTIRFGAEEFLDRRDLTPEEFWRRCKGAESLPETAAPAPGAFQRAFEEAADQGADGVLCLCISSGVSATFQAAVTGAEAARQRLPVEVVDTRSLTMGQGLIALAAAEAAAEGAALNELVTASEDLARRTRMFGAIDTLEHLQKGGRIGGAAALVGSLLSIKPVVQLKDGKVEQESRQRTRARSLEYLANKAASEAPLERLAVCNGAAGDIGVLIAMLDDVEVAHPMMTVDLGPVVGTHSGPGTIGLCYQLPAGRGEAGG